MRSTSPQLVTYAGHQGLSMVPPDAVQDTAVPTPIGQPPMPTLDNYGGVWSPVFSSPLIWVTPTPIY